MQIKVQWKYHEHFSNFKMSHSMDTRGRRSWRMCYTVRIRDAVTLSSAALKLIKCRYHCCCCCCCCCRVAITSNASTDSHTSPPVV